MTKTKQTAPGGSSSRPEGMTTARFGDDDDSQFEDIPKEDWPDVENPKCQAAQQATGEASKAAGEAGDQPTQAEGGATAPPKENPPPSTNSKPGTSKGDTQDPAKDPQEPPKEENEPGLVRYVKSYRQVAKVWFETVQASKEQAYITLYDTLLQTGDPHISKLSDSDRKTVLDCIAGKSGKYLSKDDFAGRCRN